MKLGSAMIDIWHVVAIVLQYKAKNPSLGIAETPQYCKGVSPFPQAPPTTNTYTHISTHTHTHNHNHTTNTI